MPSPQSQTGLPPSSSPRPPGGAPGLFVSRTLNRTFGRTFSLTGRRWLPGEAIDGIMYALLAVGYYGTTFKIARYQKMTHGSAVLLAVGIWGALMSLAWRLSTGPGYRQYRAQVMFGVRLNLVLMGLSVPLVLLNPTTESPPLLEYLYILVFGAGWAAALCIVSAFLPLSLLPHSVLSAVAAAVIPVNAHRICLGEYMAQSVNQRRTAAALRALQRLGPTPRLAALAPRAACQAAMTSLHYLVGIVLATAVVVEMRARARLKQQWLAAVRRGRPFKGPDWVSAANKVLLCAVCGDLVVVATLWAYSFLA